MTLSEMKRILARDDLRLTKSLGQHFLHDGNQLRRIVAAAELTRADKVLEIGPGLGPLTELLLERAAEVLAVEKDRRLFRFLQERFPGAGPSGNPRPGTAALRLLHADALEIVRDPRRDWSDWKLVSNLPYSVASPLLVELAQHPRPPKRLVVTLQREVARRLMARAGDADYGVLTLLVQLRYEPRASFAIAATCFHPPPEVDSACLTLLRRPAPLLEGAPAAAFTRLVKLAFSQRRKMLRKLLTTAWPGPQVDAAFARLGLAPDVRAERVPLEQFAQLTQRLGLPGGPAPTTTVPDPPPSPAGAEEIFDVVNERDEVVGRSTRREVHRLGLKHRATHVLVFNARGELFLQKRSSKKDNHPGVWDSSASGHLDAGEAYDACAVRELREELGLVVERAPERLFKIAACAATGQEFVWVYRCQADGPFTLHPEEIECGGWFRPERVTRWIAERPQDFAPTFPLIWERWRARQTA